MKMDMSKYAGSSFIKLEDVELGPLREVIEGVKQGQYDKAVIEFESGRQFSLNVTNVQALIKAFGKESRDWLGETVELYPGKTKYQGELTDSVLVRAVTSEAGGEKKPSPKQPPGGGSLDDEIPF
jgi:hypothetical protein